jgi:hypothetical protein
MNDGLQIYGLFGLLESALQEALFVADAARSGMRTCNRPSSRACFCRLDCTRWIIFRVSMHDSGVYISIMQIRCILELVETCRDKDPNLMAVY